MFRLLVILFVSIVDLEQVNVSWEPYSCLFVICQIPVVQEKLKTV